MKLTTIYFLIFFCSFVFAGTIDPNIPDSEYISYAKHFNYVGKIEGTNIDGSKFIASAVAIDDHHILTAAHIIQHSKSCTVLLKDKKFDIVYFKKPKEFRFEKAGYLDIALGFSNNSFDLTFYPQLYTDSDEIGKLCCIAGYGKTGTFQNGAVTFDGKLRAGSNIIDSSYRDLLICSPSSTHCNKRTSLEFLISYGDSGGGLFIGDKLAGINSCVLTNDNHSDSSYDDESGHTKISKFVNWIETNKTKP